MKSPEEFKASLGPVWISIQCPCGEELRTLETEKEDIKAFEKKHRRCFIKEVKG